MREHRRQPDARDHPDAGDSRALLTPPGAARRRDRLGRAARAALIPTLALVTALLLGGVVIVLTDFEHLRLLGTDPAGAISGALGGLVDAYRAMVAGAIGDPARVVEAVRSGSPAAFATAIWPLTEALVSATAFIFVGLGLAVALRGGLLNLGADGQVVIGGLGAVTVATLASGALPPILVLALAVVAGTLAAAAWALIAGVLKVRTGAHEVITTLMLNAIAPQVALFVFNSGVLAPRALPRVPLLIDLPPIRLDWSFVVALLTAAGVSFLLFRTTLGFRLRATGFSSTAARSAGMRPDRSVVTTMALSGGLAGMGAALLTLGAGSPGGVGFVGLALALLGGLRPSGVVAVALLYGALTNGAKQMVIATDIPLDLLVVIVAFAMLFVAAPGLVRSIWRLKSRTPEPVAARIDLPAGPL